MPISGGKKKKASDPVERFLNQGVSLVSNKRGSNKSGELFGLEFELEGDNLWPPQTVAGWTSHQDGSLRGDTNVEYVSSTPATYKRSITRIDKLFSALDKGKCKIKNSYRCSTHVHLNYSDKYVYQVMSMFIAFTMLEDILARWCGEHRSGNLFCLGARDAENIVSTMEDSTFRHNSFLPFSNALRYAGLNLCSLNKFGTIEIRTMRGVNNSDDAKNWLRIMNELYVWSLNNRKSPAELLESVSELGAIGFVESIFSKEVADMLIGRMNENDVHSSLYEGLRLIQMFAYTVSNHWNITSEYKAEEVEDKEDEEPQAGVAGEMNGGRRIIINDQAQYVWSDTGALLTGRDMLAHSRQLNEAVREARERGMNV